MFAKKKNGWGKDKPTKNKSDTDNRTRSKWSRIMRNAENCKKRGESLEDWIRGMGGINECAVRSRQLKSSLCIK